tara:strand:- start:504 stop:1322 length:819 start_codon:yes stop_codon:yes gene_type:complete
MQFNVFKKEENFKILKAEKINKIFISDMYGNNIIIQKEIDKWTVNNKHEANLEIIERLISDLEKIEIKYPVSKNSINTVTKEMAIKSVKFVFYNKEKVIKSFFVGGPTTDYLGTYMKNEKSQNIYVTHIPQHRGFLTPRFNIVLNQAKLSEWRSKKIINMKYENIEEVSIDSKIIKNKNIIKNISKIECSKFVTDEYDLNFLKDLKLTKPIKKIKIKTKTGKQISINLYNRYILDRSDTKILDKESMLGVIDNDLFIMQNNYMEKLLTQSNL